MNVKELNRDQLIQLKELYLTLHLDDVSYGELMDADDIVRDEIIFDEYAGTNFVPDDFWA